MITVANFTRSEEAHLLRMRLEAGGVPAFVLDENTIQTFSFYSGAEGSIRVQIHEDDLEQAKAILEAPLDLEAGAEMEEQPSATES